MLYYLVRPVARYAFRAYLGRIDISGLQHIPAQGPVILAANHPTAFLEPCLLACFQHRPLHFLARGDLFHSWWTRLLLRGLHILPVYRLKDGGYGKLTENYGTFAACHEVLGGGGALMILAEGRCIHEKRLRPLRKGTARVALGALAADPSLGNIPIVPVGVNFVAAERLLTPVMIRCGAPLATADYLERYRQHPATAMRELTRDLRAAISPLVVQFPDRALDDCYETYLEVRRNDAPQGGEQLEIELAAVPDFDPTNCSAVRAYAARLRYHRLTDADVVGVHAARGSALSLFFALLTFLPLAPVWGLAQLIAARGPKTVAFYSPVRFAALAVGLLAYVPAYLLLAQGFVLRVGLLYGLMFLPWALRRWDVWRQARGRRRFLRLAAAERNLLLELRIRAAST